MSKPPFDPNLLTDQPESGGGTLPTPQYDVSKVIREVKGMLVGDEFEYAERFLRDVLATMERRKEVTPAQVQAIENIAAKPYNKSQRRSRWGGGW